MPKKRFSDERIAFAPRRAEAGARVGEIRRELGIAEATFCRWKKVRAVMGVSGIRRLKRLEEENGKLKRLVADLTLDKTMVSRWNANGPRDIGERTSCEKSGEAPSRWLRCDHLPATVRRREVVRQIRSAHAVSERRACQAGGFGRASHGYRSRRDPAVESRMRLKELAESRARHGCRRPHVPLRREGWQVDHERTCRLYGEEGLSIRTRSPRRRRARRCRSGRAEAERMNDVRDFGECVHSPVA